MKEFLIPSMRVNPERFYVPQIEPRENIEAWVNAEWTPERWRLPESNWCAMTNVRSYCMSLGKIVPSLEELYSHATKYLVYRDIDDRIIGAYHASLATFIELEFSLVAEAKRNMSAADVAAALMDDCAVFASVSPQIRCTDAAPAPKNPSGHFVFVYGLGLDSVILHNSAGFVSNETQSHVVTPWWKFMECFSGRAIVVHPKKQS